MTANNIQEASENVLSLRDDDTGHFEFLLRYIYTNHYDADQIAKQAGNDAAQRVLIPMSISVVADKYEVDTLYQLVVNDVRTLLSKQDGSDFDLLKAAITTHFAQGTTKGTSMGKEIASVVLHGKRKFTESPAYEAALETNPAFAQDMALALARTTINVFCNSCRRHLTARADARAMTQQFNFYCNFCQSNYTQIQEKTST